MSAVYVRYAGGHVAERVRPLPGSARATELRRAAATGTGGWQVADESTPAPTLVDDLPEGSGGAGSGPDAVGRPARAARKADWVAYAVAQGADRTEAEASTKDDLVTAYGGDDGADSA